MKIDKTHREFNITEFKDVNGYKCSLQKSSRAMEDYVWLGVNNHNAQIMASKAKEHGIKTNENTGWVDYPIPEDVLMTTRMHLNREQVADLLPYLQRFVETGELTDNESNDNSSVVGKYIIVQDIELNDYMKDEEGKIKTFNSYQQALETCGIYEFENALILRVIYNHIENE